MNYSVAAEKADNERIEIIVTAHGSAKIRLLRERIDKERQSNYAAEKEGKGNEMSEGRKKAVAAGHICLDITPEFFRRQGDGGTAQDKVELFRPGSLTEVGTADIHIGGSVSNTGLAMKFFGTDVTLMGKIGTDEFGKLVQNGLREWNAQEGLLISETESTSYSIVLAPEGTDRIFLHHPGANAGFKAEDLNFDVIREADLFHFGYPTLMRNLYKNGGSGLVNLLRMVKETGIAVSLDMAAIDGNSEAALENWENILRAALPFVDFFVPSAEELAFMADRSLYESWKEKAAGGDLIGVITESEIGRLGEKMLGFGAGVVLIKCGAKGMYLCSAGADRLKYTGGILAGREEEWSGIRHFEKSFRPDRIVSGTGAGDTSIAAFLSAVLSGSSYRECVGLAAGAGALCVSAYDALSGLRPLSEIRERIRDGWEKN